jgi:hypothetical protein
VLSADSYQVLDALGDRTLEEVVAEHAAPSTVEESGGTAALPVAAANHELEHFSGRPISWVGVTVTCVGFVVGGVGFFFHPVIWWLFWVGVAIAVVGGIILLSAKTLWEDWY